MTTRRSFLGASAALVGAASFPFAPVRASKKAAGAPLNLLFLGGTGFIGPHQVEYALTRGHRVTIFHRGNRPGLFGDRVEELVGDRDSKKGVGLAALAGERRWDVVIDNSGYVPRHVRDSAELLRERVGRYLFTSTVAVYDYDVESTVDRDGPLRAAPDPATERVTGASYGPLKAECDAAVREIYGERATVVRPCYIVGPGDTSDRFTYWVDRLHRGGDVVCPAHPEREAQWIDVRDLAPWMIRLAEDDVAGTFNGVGPASPVTNEILMHGLRACASAPTRLFWASAELLDEHSFPTPMFDRHRSDRHTDGSAAVAAGLPLRSLADTARDLQAWWLAQPESRRQTPRGWPSAKAELTVLEHLTQ